MAQGLANQIANSVPGMRVAAIYARQLEQALGILRVRRARRRRGRDRARPRSRTPIRADRPVVTDDAFLLCRAEQIDVLVDVTGSVEFGAQVVLEAVAHGKHIVLMNAELDATIGPILNVHAQRAGVIMSACDGDEPGLQMNLVRWVAGPRAHAARDRQRQGPAGPVPQPGDAGGRSPRSGARTRRW